MRLTGIPCTLEEIRGLGLKGALYIRMSTEMQAESPEIQERQMRAFADKYGIEIIKLYADLGVSGITAENREGFLTLISDVENSRHQFNIVLYLDESRWGRFVDSREADYYRMCLERKGVLCRSCESDLVVQQGFAERIATMVKDESASAYSRQLSQKVFAGQSNLIMQGFRQGGPAGYGLRRMLLDDKGERKQELAIGQRKSLQTERVILVPGPSPELSVVRWTYDLFISGLREGEIACRLNESGHVTDFGRPWTRGTVRQVLTNEKYIGNNVFNRASGKLKSKRRNNPENEWVRKEEAFIPIIDKERFFTVQGMIKERNKKISNEELLSRLKGLYKRRGWLSALVIDEAEEMPPSSLYSSRFGGLLRAYKLIGYIPGRDYHYVLINQRLRVLHSGIVTEVVREIESLCGRGIFVDPETGLIELNHNLLISIVISRCCNTSSGTRRWKIRFDCGLRPDITIAVRMDGNNEVVHDYYLLPALEFSHEQLRLSEDNAGLLDSFRTDSLDYLLRLGINIPLDKAVTHGTWSGGPHPG